MHKRTQLRESSDDSQGSTFITRWLGEQWRWGRRSASRTTTSSPPRAPRPSSSAAPSLLASSPPRSRRCSPSFLLPGPLFFSLSISLSHSLARHTPRGSGRLIGRKYELLIIAAPFILLHFRSVSFLYSTIGYIKRYIFFLYFFFVIFFVFCL